MLTPYNGRLLCTVITNKQIEKNRRKHLHIANNVVYIKFNETNKDQGKAVYYGSINSLTTLVTHFAKHYVHE